MARRGGGAAGPSKRMRRALNQAARATEAESSDWSLLQGVVRKDEASLLALYERYSLAVYTQSKRILRDENKASETLQEMFREVWRTAARFDEARGSFAGWLLLVARNRAVEKLRGRRKGEELDENGVHLRLDLNGDQLQTQLRARTRAILAEIPEKQRLTVEACYFEGRTYEEIAAKTGEAAASVKKLLHDGLEALRRAGR